MDPRKKEELKGISVRVEKTPLNRITYTLVESDSSGAAFPQYQENMIPIVYQDNQWVKADPTNANQSWFDYSKQQWANVATVKEEVRQDLITAPLGTPVPMDNMVGMFVWIPRYRYQLWNVDGRTNPVGNPYLIDDTKVNIEFESIGVKKAAGTQNGQWLTHPAFTLGDQEVNGFWASKFEVSSQEGNGNTTDLDNVITKTPIFLPNRFAWRYQTLATLFHNSRRITELGNIHGLLPDQDGHVFKNKEWGAMSYLTISRYGKTGNKTYQGQYQPVKSNINKQYITGCGSQNNTVTETCVTYDTKDGQAASTTGNITGVYDTAGGSFDFVMAIQYQADNQNLDITESGFTAEEIQSIKDRYIDAYLYSEDPVLMTSFQKMHLGDATIETGPFSDVVVSSNMVYYRNSAFQNAIIYQLCNTRPVATRGGRWDYLEVGSLFVMEGTYGNPTEMKSAHFVII